MPRCRLGAMLRGRSAGTGMVDAGVDVGAGARGDARVVGRRTEGPLRILVTNDDGVRAPGIAALALVAASTGHDVVVVAPLIDYSGSGAAVGPGPLARRRRLRGPRHRGSRRHAHLRHRRPAGPGGDPRLCGWLRPPARHRAVGDQPRRQRGAVGHALGHGGGGPDRPRTSGSAAWPCRSAGATTPCRGRRPAPWRPRSVPVLAQAPAGTTLNLNVPNVRLDELRGLRHGRLGRGGTIRSAVHVTGDDSHAPPPCGAPARADRHPAPGPHRPGEQHPGPSRHRRRTAGPRLRVADGAGRGARGRAPRPTTWSTTPSRPSTPVSGVTPGQDPDDEDGCQ